MFRLAWTVLVFSSCLEVKQEALFWLELAKALGCFPDAIGGVGVLTRVNNQAVISI